MKLYNCNVCGSPKDLQKTKKDGTVFMSCPNWQDPKHVKAREDWKRENQGAPQGTYNASQRPQPNLNNTPDVYDLLTTLVAKVNAIYEKVEKLSILDETPY